LQRKITANKTFKFNSSETEKESYLESTKRTAPPISQISRVQKVLFSFPEEGKQRTSSSSPRTSPRVQKDGTSHFPDYFTFIKMLTAAGFFSFLLHVCFPPFLVVLGIILCLASIGKSLGIRRLYVKALLRIFEVSGFPDFGPL
jgi:hypothetical protein